MNLKKILATLIFCWATLYEGEIAFGAGKKSSSSYSSSSVSAQKDFLITLPVIATESQLLAHMEWNLSGQAGLGVEAGLLGEKNDLAKHETEKQGEEARLATQGLQATILISRYSEPQSLGGFYWTLGLGYRKMIYGWYHKPEDDDQESLGLTKDDKGYLNQEMEASGPTGHGRGGYRYVADSVPFAVGVYLGLRHFRAELRDVPQSDETNDKPVSPSTSSQQSEMAKRYSTRPELGIEIGMAF